MKSVYLIFAVAILVYCNTALAQEPVDPNLMWVSDSTWKHSILRFLVHPNGNILAGSGHLGEGSKQIELDGNTGKIIREFAFPAFFFDISPDGKYISGSDKEHWRCVIDYETDTIIRRYTPVNTRPKFMPDSKSLIFQVLEGTGYHYKTKLVRYNIKTNGSQYSPNGIERTTAWNLAVSPDGRFVATGGRYVDGVKEYTRFVLWDAQTLDTIRILADLESRGGGSIKFSPDSRLVGFQVYASNLYIYNTETLQLYKYYNTATGFGFITNDYIALGNGYENPPFFNLLKLDNDQVIYTKNNSSGISEYNPTNNTMIVHYGVIYCYDFSKILAGASIKPELPNQFMVEYKNNTLFIKGHAFTSVQLTAQIADINGKIIRHQEINTSTGDIRIPIKLLSGTYFLHIKDGGKEYVSKFLVTN